MSAAAPSESRLPRLESRESSPVRRSQETKAPAAMATSRMIWKTRPSWCMCTLLFVLRLPPRVKPQATRIPPCFPRESVAFPSFFARARCSPRRTRIFQEQQTSELDDKRGADDLCATALDYRGRAYISGPPLGLRSIAGGHSKRVREEHHRRPCRDAAFLRASVGAVGSRFRPFIE